MKNLFHTFLFLFLVFIGLNAKAWRPVESSPGDKNAARIQSTQTYKEANISYLVTSAGEALNFDGSNDYVSVPDNTSLNFGTGDFTVESYFQSAVSQPNYAGIVVKATSGGNVGFQLVVYNNKLAAEFSNGSVGLGVGNGLIGTTTITDGTWHHVAMVVTRSQNKIELFVDGSVESSVINSSISSMNINATVPVLMGVERTYIAHVNGNLDEVRLWNIARTKCELNTYKNCEIPTTATGLVGNYHFNQGFAGVTNNVNTLTDDSGNSNTGTLTNFALTGTTSNWIAPGGVVSGFTTPASAPAVTATPSSTTICNSQSALLTGGGAVTYTWSGGITNAVAFTPTSTASYTVTGTASTGCTNTAIATVSVNNCTAGAALDLDGADDDVRATGFSNFTEYTIEGWFKLNSLVNQNLIVGTGNGNPNTWFTNQIRLNAGKFEHYLYDGTVQTIASPATVSTGVWYHVAIVAKNGTPVRIYVNGTQSVSVSNVGTMSGANEYRLGGTANGNLAAFNGQMDEVRIWNVARTQCEINTYKNCEIPTTATGLLANYHFNQGFAAVTNTVMPLTNAAGGSYNGTLVNFALTGATSNWVAPGGVISGSTTPASAPVITASPSSTTICNSQSAVLTGGGAVTYSWSGGIADAVAFAPASTSSYTVTGTASTGCTNIAVATVNVNNCNAAAALNFDGVNDNVNIGNTMNTTLDPLNKITVEAWVKPSTNTGLGVIIGNYDNPSNNTQMQFLLRRDADQYAMWVDAGSGFQVVNSGVGTVTASIWQHVAGVWDGSKLQVYINGVLKGTTNGVTGSSFITTTNPVIIGYNGINENFNGSIDEVRVWTLARTQCEINTFKNCEIATTATGLLANYHFNQGFDAVTNTVTALTNAASGSYNGTLNNFALTGATSNWIAPGGVVTGSVTPASLTPVVTANATNSVICNGGSTILNGGGATTYTWSGGVTNGVSFSPANTVTYTVIGTNAATGCTNTATQAVTVNPLPVVTAAISASVICEGATTTFNGGGADTYTWTGGVTDGIAFTPTVSGSYNITGTNTLTGCTNTAIASVTVNTLPVVAAAISNSVICSGFSTTLNGGGADTYTWTSGITDGVAFTPAVTGSYTVTGTNTLTGCTSTNVAVTSVTVNPNPVITAASGAICMNGSYTITPNGASTYTISGGSAIVSPSVTTSYSVTGTSVDGCTGNTAVVTVSVQSSLTVSIAGSNTVCDGNAVNLTANGAATYSWNTGSTSNTIAPTPTVNTTYSVVGSSGSCSNLAVVTITVNANPTVTAVSNSSLICAGQSVSLTSSGATTYTWNGSMTGSTISDTPTTTTTYTVTGADVNGCTNTAMFTQNVSPCTGIYMNKGMSTFVRVYPNPATGMITVEVESNATVTVLNAMGQVIRTTAAVLGKNQVDISEFVNGIYFVKVIQNGTQQTMRLIKQ